MRFGQIKASRVVTFRTTITLVVMVLVTALAIVLIIIQAMVVRIIGEQAASSHMDVVSADIRNRLETPISELFAVIESLSTSPFLANSNDRSETDGAIRLFKTALNAMPQADSLYIAYDNGAWLQVRRLSTLKPEQRRRLDAPETASININLIRPLPDGALPLRRIFESADGIKLDQIDLWNYGYDARQRSWYRDTMDADQPLVSSPYLSFSIETPMLTLSAPLRGTTPGVIAADLKLDSFSDFVHAHRPGERGLALLFDPAGVLIAYPQLAGAIEYAATHPSRSHLPTVKEITDPLVPLVINTWNGIDDQEGKLRNQAGERFLFRLRHFTAGDHLHGHLLLIASQNDFVQEIWDLELKGLLIAICAGGCFVPLVWFLGGRLSASLRRITAQAEKLWTLAPPSEPAVKSYVREIGDLGATILVAQRTVWSFSRFVPRELVKGVIDGSIPTVLGGVRREVTILFTDVRNFTGIAEAADPDCLTRQTSRYFAALTVEFLAEGGTVDKFIGDSVMVFWNAPHQQPDHVERACRAALAAKQASVLLNARFETEGLPPFVTRIGIHVGDVVVGNVGSMDRMNYTVLGNSVNLAARLEALNKRYGTAILVSAALRDRVGTLFLFEPVASVTADGMTQETIVYELIGSTVKEGMAVRQTHAASPVLREDTVDGH